MGAVKEIKTFSIEGVEVFSTGTWNKDNYDINDLQHMIDAFNQTKGGWRPYLKLGHDPKQKVAKSSGLPAVGWVNKLYLRGTKLLADLTDIPEKVYQAILAKSYRKVSCEIYSGLEINGTKYPQLLGAVALLGAEHPGVENLDDILGTFSFLEAPQTEMFAFMQKQDTFKAYSHTFELETSEDLHMSVELQKELDAKKTEFSSLQATAKAEKDAADKEISDLKKFKADAEAKAVADAIALKEAKLATFVTSLDSKKLLTPVTKKIVEQLLGDKQEFSLDDKKLSKEEAVEKLLSLSLEAGKINREEVSQSEFAAKGKNGAEDDMDKEVSKYAADNKCTYAVALKAVAKLKKNSAKKSMDADE